MDRDRPAGFLRRVFALALDCLLIQSALAFLTMIAFAAVHEGARASGIPNPSDESVDRVLMWLVVLWLLLPVFYFTFFISFGGQTPAKRIAKIQVIPIRRTDRISPVCALIRTLAYWISAASLGIGFFWIFLNRDRRALHDLIAGTRVIRRA